jgi:hypothetical protein
MPNRVVDMSPASEEDVPCPVCWHEAGHAMTALTLGVAIKRVVAKKGFNGALDLVDPVSADQTALIRVAYAGAVAEQVGARVNGARPSEQDAAIAQQAMTRLYNDTRQHQDRFTLQHQAEQYARALFKSDVAKLESLARYICEKGAKVGGISWSEMEAEWARLLVDDGTYPALPAGE